MGIVGGPRTHHAAEASVAFKWDCPACGAENLGPFAEGCPSCGAGTAQQAAMAAQRKHEVTVVTVASLNLAVLAPEFAQYALTDWLTPLTPAAKVTTLRALEFYLAQGARLDETELSTEVLRGWRLALEPADDLTT